MRKTEKRPSKKDLPCLTETTQHSPDYTLTFKKTRKEQRLASLWKRDVNSTKKLDSKGKLTVESLQLLIDAQHDFDCSVLAFQECEFQIKWALYLSSTGPVIHMWHIIKKYLSDMVMLQECILGTTTIFQSVISKKMYKIGWP